MLLIVLFLEVSVLLELHTIIALELKVGTPCLWLLFYFCVLYIFRNFYTAKVTLWKVSSWYYIVLSFIHLTKSKFDTMIVECTISIVTLGGEGRKSTPENAVIAGRVCCLSWTKKCATIFNINLMANNHYVNRMYNVILTA